MAGRRGRPRGRRRRAGARRPRLLRRPAQPQQRRLCPGFDGTGLRDRPRAPRLLRLHPARLLARHRPLREPHRKQVACRLRGHPQAVAGGARPGSEVRRARGVRPHRRVRVALDQPGRLPHPLPGSGRGVRPLRRPARVPAVRPHPRRDHDPPPPGQSPGPPRGPPETPRPEGLAGDRDLLRVGLRRARPRPVRLRAPHRRRALDPQYIAALPRPGSPAWGDRQHGRPPRLSRGLSRGPGRGHGQGVDAGGDLRRPAAPPLLRRQRRPHPLGVPAQRPADGARDPLHPRPRAGRRRDRLGPSRPGGDRQEQPRAPSPFPHGPRAHGGKLAAAGAGPVRVRLGAVAGAGHDPGVRLGRHHHRRGRAHRGPPALLHVGAAGRSAARPNRRPKRPPRARAVVYGASAAA